MKRALPFLIALAAGSLGVESARAAAPEVQPRRVEWRPEWKRVASWEMALSATLGASIAGIVLFAREGEPAWKEPFVLDDPVRDFARARTPEGRARAQLIGNLTYYGALAYPVLVDVVATAWLGHRSPEVAGQMLLMDLEAMSITGFLSFVSNALIRRQRPYVRECNEKDDYVFPDCRQPGKSESFFSGHTAIAATTAGLTCAHHAALPLYGGGVGDTLACLSTIAGAAVTGYTRLIADKHYLLDVIVGLGLGFPIGYAIARYHYARPKETTSSGKSTFQAQLLPDFGAERFGLTLIGRL